MLKKRNFARAAALIATIAFVAATMPLPEAAAQETPSVAIQQARSGEDGSSGAGATSGNATSGNANRDNNGNGGNASSGSAGEGGETGTTEGTSESLPENAELLDALGVLDDVTAAGIDVLTGLNIPVELLPAPVEEPVTAVPTDINTGGQGGTGETSSISTEPGSSSAPASGATSSAAEDGVGSSESGERNRDRPRNNDDGTTETATATG